jgi:excisionase family DNA binding protein
LSRKKRKINANNTGPSEIKSLTWKIKSVILLKNLNKGGKMEPYLTIAEIAEVLKVTPRTIDNWIKDDGLPYFSVKDGKGSVRRFLESDVRKWFENFQK